MKIAIITYQYPHGIGLGGIATYSYNLAHGLCRLGHEVHIIAHTDPEDEDEKECFDGKVRVHRICEPKWTQKFSLIKVFAYRWRIRQKISELNRQIGLDIIETPNWLFEGLFLLFRNRKYKVVCRIHTPLFEHFASAKTKPNFKANVLCFLEKLVVLSSDDLVTSTRYYADKMKDAYNMVRQKISIVSLGIELPELDESANTSEGKVINILYVGRLEMRKGTQYLLEAITYILSKHNDIKFTLIGKDINNIYKERFTKETQNKYGEKVQFLGFVSAEKLQNYYRNCDIFVAPSLSESFGLIFIEAMSWGKPVVACDVCAVSSVVENEKSGILVPPRDSNAISEALIDLIENKEKRQAMGARGREICEKKFSLDMMVQNMEKFYKSSLKT